MVFTAAPQDSFLGPAPSHTRNLFTPSHMCLSVPPRRNQPAPSLTGWELMYGTARSVQYHLIVLGLKYEISLQICPEETGMLCERRQ